jgi:hypothetical protein
VLESAADEAAPEIGIRAELDDERAVGRQRRAARYWTHQPGSAAWALPHRARRLGEAAVEHHPETVKITVKISASRRRLALA